MSYKIDALQALNQAHDAERQTEGVHWTFIYRLGVAFVYALLEIASAIREKE